MPASLKDVANMAHVSLTTASHALNGKPVNEETRARVLDVAKKLHYYVNVNGRNLITRKTHNLSLVVLNEEAVGDMTEALSYYYQMLKGVMECAQQNQYSVKYEVVSWEQLQKDEYFEKKVYGRSVDGIIVIPQFKYRCDFFKLFEDEKFPYVVINPWTEVAAQHRVSVDNYSGGVTAAHYIWENKIENIYFINGPRDHVSASLLEEGFLAELLKRGVQFDRKHILYSDYTFEGGHEKMERIMGQADVTGAIVFCANDYMAAGVIMALKEAGHRVPDDVSVMGFDGMEISKYVYPGITTVQVNTKLLGLHAAKRLLTLIASDEGAEHLESITLQPELLIRNTVKKR